MNGNLSIIKFLLDNNAVFNKQTEIILNYTPLHSAIHENHFAVCKLILGYEQAVTHQNVERGIEIAKLKQHLEIQVLLEKELERRHELINSTQDPKTGQKICSFCKQIPEKRKKCGKCKIAIYCSRECQAQDWMIHKLKCEDK
jgi:hypothetical protein